MKQRSREINIFSISALDLFASALGAFILVSLVFMVFFTMTAKTAAPEAPEPVAAPERPEAPLPDPMPIPPLDIVICLDVTGSMSDQIHGLKQEIDDLAQVLDRLAPSVGIGVVAYGDRLFDRVVEKHAIVSTDAMSSLRQFVQALEPKISTPFRNPNPDLPEAVDRGLAEAAAMNWRTESERRYIIVVGDAAAYPEERASAFARAARFAEADGHHVSAVMVARRNAESFFRQLAASGRGQFVDDVGGQSMIASVLLAILDV